MAQNVSMIGFQPEELPWMRLLVSLLRHPDPSVPELARRALEYLADTSATPVTASYEKERCRGVS
jgi:hypothetical protein